MQQDAPNSISEIRERQLKGYRGHPNRIVVDANNERQDRAGYDGRFIFELLQNAADEMTDTDEPAVRIELSGDTLYVANNGRAFDIKDLYALTLIAATTKAGDSTIGHKGRGFTSVLGVTDRPSVYSETVSATFDRKETRSLLLSDTEIAGVLEDGLEPDDVPILSIPSETEPPDIVESLLTDGYTTVFQLPLREPGHHRSLIEERLRSLDANTVGLLPDLRHIEIVSAEWEHEWQIERTDFSCTGDPTLVEITENRHQDRASSQEQHRLLLFQSDDIDRADIVAQSSLEKKEVEAMGELSVTVGFRAVTRSEEPDGPGDWAIAPVYAEWADEAPYLHVFLPTRDRSPIPALVSGTFQTDTSRRKLPLEHEPEAGYERQFNALLFGAAAELIAESVVRFVPESATEPRELIAALDPTFGGQLDPSHPVGSVEHCLLEQIKDELSNWPFIPVLEESDVRTIEEIVLPHTSEKFADLGRKYARVVGQPNVSIDGVQRWIPARSLLDHTTVRALAALNADELDLANIPYTIATSIAEPDLDIYETATEGDDGEVQHCRLLVDPVLKVLTDIRKTLEADEDRDTLDNACRSAAVFPSAILDDGETYKVDQRISTTESTPFLPPQEDVPSDALPGIQFLPRELYHGTNPELAPSLRAKHVPDLKTQLITTWGVRRYEFDSVFDSAISPHLPGPRSTDVEPSRLEQRDTLEAIRELASVGFDDDNRSPDEPLLYKSSRRPYQALSRLRVPARTLSDQSDIQWRPAHEVYFSAAWPTKRYDDDRVHSESLFHELEEHIDGFDPALLVEPDWFDVEEDEEDMNSWYDFFLWLGVAEHLRPLPFFPPGSQHRYKNTGSLNRPGGSAIDAEDLADERYSKLEENKWDTYREHLQQAFDAQTEDQYIHQINPLEYGAEIRTVLRSDHVPDSVRRRFLDHLVDWWDGGFDRFQHPQLAEFTNDNWRGRSKTRYFKKSELRTAGWNLWLWQLQRAAWMPTTHGKEEPRCAWIGEKNEVKRFRLRDRPLLPIVEYERRNLRRVAPALEIGVDPEESFAPSDAVFVLRQVAEGYEKTGGMEGAIERVYSRVARNMDNPSENPSWDIQECQFSVLCHEGPSSYTFEPEIGPFYARSHRERELYERLGVPMINLFKENLSVRFGKCIGATDVRDAIQLEPEPAVVCDDLMVDVDGFQLTPDWIETVLAGFLLRLRIDRPTGADDLSRTQRFYEKLTVVEDLVLMPSGRAVDETPIDGRHYFIERDADANRILIDRCLTGDEFKEALAKAYTEYLDISSHYEGVIRIVDTAFHNHEPEAEIIDDLSAVGSSATDEELLNIPIAGDSVISDSNFENEDEPPESDKEVDSEHGAVTSVRKTTEPTQRTVRAERVPDPMSIHRIGDGIVSPNEFGDSDQSQHTGGGGGGNDRPPQVPTEDYREKIDKFGMTAVRLREEKRLGDDGDPAKCIWDVSKAETYEDLVDGDAEDGTERDAQPLREAIERFGTELEDSNSNPLEAPWPGFDVLTLKCTDGIYEIDRCIELKTTARKTYKPSISWNQWKAASGTLRDNFYLYVVRNVRKGNSGEAELLEVPHPFWTLTKKTQERKKLEVQFDLRDFDSDHEEIWQHPIEWEESDSSSI